MKLDGSAECCGGGVLVSRDTLHHTQVQEGKIKDPSTREGHSSRVRRTRMVLYGAPWAVARYLVVVGCL